MNKVIGNRTKFQNHRQTMVEMALSSDITLKNNILRGNNEWERDMFKANIPDIYFELEWPEVREGMKKAVGYEKKADKVVLNQKNQDDVINKIEQYFKNLENAYREGIGLYMYGNIGVGKTSVACLVLKMALKQKLTAYFCRSKQLIDYVTRGWRDENKRNDWEYLYNNVDFFVIDDIYRAETRIDNERERQYIEDVFMTRNNKKLPTIITSNNAISADRSLVSRFKSSMWEIEIKGTDFRPNMNIKDRLMGKTKHGKTGIKA